MAINFNRQAIKYDVQPLKIDAIKTIINPLSRRRNLLARVLPTCQTTVGVAGVYPDKFFRPSIAEFDEITCTWACWDDNTIYVFAGINIAGLICLVDLMRLYADLIA